MTVTYNTRCLIFLVVLISFFEFIAASPKKSMVRRADLPDPITEWSAFGDSYAAGIGTSLQERALLSSDVQTGAGKVIFSEDQVFDGSYPWQMDTNDPRIGNVEGRPFHDVAHSGAKIQYVIDNVPENIGNPQLVTLQIGGNDMGFYNVMTACVFRFGANFAGNCSEELSKAQVKLDNDMPGALDKTIQTIFENAPNLMKLAVIGYGTPFNADTTLCDGIHFSFWKHLDETPQYLTQERRRNINDIVRKLNEVIQAAVKRADQERVLFVNYDKNWDGHRFCEEGVEEPAKNYDNTWFFNLPNIDDADISLDLSVDRGLLDLKACDRAAQDSGDWSYLSACEISRAQPEIGVIFSGSYGGPEYGRIAHPKPIGHLAIADAVMDALGKTGRGGWSPGSCGVHITHRQKINPSDPNSHYRLDVSVKDGKSRTVGTIGYVDAPSGQGVNAGSRLPHYVIVTAQDIDDDPLLFAYAGQNWTSDDDQCKFGGYEDGNREGDCGFLC